MAKDIKIGVIGCGQFMSQQHIQTIVRSDRLDLYHVADQDHKALSRISDLYNPTRATNSWEDVVNDNDVDIVVVGVFPKFHPTITKACLENGKPVYVEKPLAQSISEGLEIQKLSEKLEIPVAVGFNRRFAPAMGFVDSVFRQAKGPFTLTYRISDDDRIRPPGQRWKKQDRLIIEVVHIFDLLSFLTDAEPVGIFAVESRYNDTLVTVDFSDGSHANILSSSWGTIAQPKEQLEAILDRASIEMSDFVEVRCFGEIQEPHRICFQGRAYDYCDNSHVKAFGEEGLAAMIKLRKKYYDAMNNAGVLLDSSDEQAWKKAKELLGNPPIPQINYTPDKGWGHALEHFCLSIMNGQKPGNADARDGNRASACAIAARKSIETSNIIKLNPKDWS